MKLADQLRNNVSNTNNNKLQKYINKLLKKLERLSKRGVCEYEIVIENLPKHLNYSLYYGEIMDVLLNNGFDVNIKSEHNCDSYGRIRWFEIIEIKW